MESQFPDLAQTPGRENPRKRVSWIQPVILMVGALEYLSHWAAEIGVRDLLERALQDAGIQKD